jgi:monoamine oxidase
MYLAKIDQIKLNSVVTEINYSSEKISIKTIDGSIKTCDKVILTIPITQYKKNAITFIPALPDQKVKALNKIGMGPGMKVFLKFNQTFYHDNIVGGSVCAAYANEKIGKLGQDLLWAFNSRKLRSKDTSSYTYSSS